MLPFLGLKQQLQLLGSFGSSLRYGLAKRYSPTPTEQASPIGGGGSGSSRFNPGLNRESGTPPVSTDQPNVQQSSTGIEPTLQAAAGASLLDALDAARTTVDRAQPALSASASLFATLDAAHSHQPGARRQLAFLFSTLPPDMQPTVAIREALRTTADTQKAGRATVGEATVNIVIYIHTFSKYIYILIYIYIYRRWPSVKRCGRRRRSRKGGQR